MTPYELLTVYFEKLWNMFVVRFPGTDFRLIDFIGGIVVFNVIIFIVSRLLGFAGDLKVKVARNTRPPSQVEHHHYFYRNQTLRKGGT